MQFTTLALSFAATIAASPCAKTAPATNSDLVTFGVVSVASGSPVQYAGWGAMHKGVYTGSKPQEGATCYGPAQDYATFVLDKAAGTLSLLTDGKPWQQFFVDRSGMAQGQLLYTTGAEPATKYAERAGWAINDANHLTFAGSDAFLACPAGFGDNLYRVLPYVGIESPAGYTNCTSIAARVVPATNKPVECLYSQDQATI